MGMFDDFKEGATPAEEERKPAASTNMFREFVEPPKPLPVTNRVFGELKPADPSWSQWLKWKAQDALMAAGAKPYVAGRLAEGGLNVASLVPPVGAARSFADLTYDLPRGNYGAAALDALGVVPGAIAAKRAIKGMPTRSLAEVPSREELGQVSGAAYGRVAQSPVEYAPEAQADVANILRTQLTRGRMNPVKAPSTYETISEMERAAQYAPGPGERAFVTPGDFDTVRQSLRTGVAFTQDSLAGKIAIEHLDRYLANPPPGRVVAGAPQDLAALRRDLAEARGNYHIKKLSDAVEGRIDKAEVAAAAAASGANLDNTTRQWLKGLITTKAGQRDIAAALPAEKEAIRNVIEGDFATNFARRTGNLLGGGGGVGRLGTYVAGHTGGQQFAAAQGLDPTTAFGAGTLTGLGVTGLGAGLRSFANKRTQAAAEKVGETIRMRSPEYQKRVLQELAQGGPPVDPKTFYRDAIAYALIPPIRDEGQDWWNQAHVPYANR